VNVEDYIALIFNFFYFFAENGEYEAVIVTGSGKHGSGDGTPTECCFEMIHGIAVDEKHTHVLLVNGIIQ
jgi:hypothetical protein